MPERSEEEAVRLYRQLYLGTGAVSTFKRGVRTNYSEFRALLFSTDEAEHYFALSMGFQWLADFAKSVRRGDIYVLPDAPLIALVPGLFVAGWIPFLAVKTGVLKWMGKSKS